MSLWEVLSARAEKARASARVVCGALGEVTVEALPVRELERLWGGAAAPDRDRGIFYAACRELQAAGARALEQGKVFRPDQVMEWVARSEAAAAARTVEAISGWKPPEETETDEEAAEQPAVSPVKIEPAGEAAPPSAAAAPPAEEAQTRAAGPAEGPGPPVPPVREGGVPEKNLAPEPGRAAASRDKVRAPAPPSEGERGRARKESGGQAAPGRQERGRPVPAGEGEKGRARTPRPAARPALPKAAPAAESELPPEGAGQKGAGRHRPEPAAAPSALPQSRPAPAFRPMAERSSQKEASEVPALAPSGAADAPALTPRPDPVPARREWPEPVEEGPSLRAAERTGSAGAAPSPPGEGETRTEQVARELLEGLRRAAWVS